MIVEIENSVTLNSLFLESIILSLYLVVTDFDKLWKVLFPVLLTGKVFPRGGSYGYKESPCAPGQQQNGF